MANSFVQLPADSTGKLLQTFNNTVGANSVHSEAVTLVRSSDNSEIGTAGQPLRFDPVGTTTQPVSIASGSIANTGFNVTPATSGGTSAYHAVAAASNNAASVKGSAGQVYGWSIYNNAAYPVYVKLYNKATAPAPATDNALLIKVIGIQAGTESNYFNPCGIAGFSSGIGIAAVKDITDTGNTSLAANDCLIELDYK